MATPQFHVPSRSPQPGLIRRDFLRRAGAAGVALAALSGSGRQSVRIAAQEATPMASPVGVGAGGLFAYVGTYTRGAPGGGGTLQPTGISIFSVDPSSGALTFVETVASDNPSWLALHPTQRFLYAVNETDDYEGEASGAVEAFALDPITGALSFLNRQSAQGLWPAHLAVDPNGNFAVSADYSGPFVVLPIGADGQLAPASDVVQNTGSGPNEERQEASHPHAVVFDPAGQFLATADLGIDKIQVYRLDAAGILEPVGEASVTPGAGPRHLAFLPDGRFLYLMNELNATVTVFAYDPASGTIGEEIQTVSSVPEGFADPKSGAEIAVHPSGNFLYASNRGGPDTTAPEADSIAAFTIDQATGELTLIGFTTEDIAYPRNFTIDPTGAWLYVCNQQGDSIVQLVIDQETGELTATGQITESPTPVSIVFTGG
ncbi:MAG: lactonase family protein [Thermomicrobiales bacterium]